MRRKSPDSPMR